VREETIQRVRIEFKYAQGQARPWRPLLGDKVTPRGSDAGSRGRQCTLSPFPFHSVYSVEDHKKHVD
jgi:glutamate synthase domain-containing protein 2